MRFCGIMYFIAYYGFLSSGMSRNLKGEGEGATFKIFLKHWVKTKRVPITLYVCILKTH